jgi:hypothetical protein
MIPPLYAMTKWRYLLKGLTFIALLIMSIEIVFDPLLTALFPSVAVFFNIVELMIVTTVFFDLGLRFIDAPNRYSFLKNRSIAIVLAIPFAILLRNTRLVEPTKLTLLKASNLVMGFFTSQFFLRNIRRLFALFRFRF